ncbi:MAG: NADPH:quinone reductase [Rhodococcus sp. (in: high G+C Gram-positive bacteria)]|uniref:NADPH:quinone reductase n=1 Tax=Rhodococcus sp. TaxID=1831 RepID=UPI003BB09FEE
MRAAVYDRTGPAGEVLRVEDVPRPVPTTGEVRVRMEVSGINPTDVKARGGAVPRPFEGFQIPHHDGTGVIDGVGDGIDEDRIGQRVWVWFGAVGSHYGTAAEWTVVPAFQAVPLPEIASAELGASLGIPAMTAHHCLFADGPLTDKTVLVAGGAGSVGHFAIELARWKQARVIATVSNAEKADLARSAGAELIVNYLDADAAEQITAFDTPIDRIIEVDLGANLALDLSLSGPHTTVVTYAASTADPTLPVRRCMNANVTMRFVLVYGLPLDELTEIARGITDALHAEALSTLPIHRYTLDQIVEAHEAVESGVLGKVVLDLR